MSNETHQQQVSIGKSFFSNEKRAYDCWTTALIRECVQNSSDVLNSRQIFFTVIGGLISIKDDGNGMTRDVLTNVFMNLGESTKKTADTCGGFGIARNLICFAQESYEIRSHDYTVKGSGSGYSITDMPLIRGCEFIIQTEIDDEGFWLEKIKDVLSRSSIRQNVFINGVQFHNTKHRGRHIRTLKCGEMYVNKSDSSGFVHVRSNGVWMFSKQMRMNATVYVEVNPQISKKVFTSNRDGMQSEYRNELDAFLSELASETTSALQPKNRKFISVSDPGKMFSVVPKGRKEPKAVEFVESTPRMNAAFGPAVFTNEPPDYNTEYESISEDDVIRSCSLLLNESDDARVAGIAMKYEPSFIGKHTTRYKLLSIWKTICDAAVQSYAEWKNQSYAYGIGWVFATDGTRAKCFTHQTATYLLLNPIDADGKIAYGLNDRDDLSMLVSIACHEVTHLCGGHNYHDEWFANDYTELVGRVMGKLNGILREIREKD